MLKNTMQYDCFHLNAIALLNYIVLMLYIHVLYVLWDSIVGVTLLLL